MRVQMRYFYLGNSPELVEQYRVCRENGWGGKWQATLYLAWVSYRSKVRTA